MAKHQMLLEQIEKGQFDETFAQLYGTEEKAILAQRQRYGNAITAFTVQFGTERELLLFSVPGRTELGGNHTDHNNGLVMAAAVNLDIIAVAAKNDDATIRVASQGFAGTDVVTVDELVPCRDEYGHSVGLVRGVLAGIAGLGGRVGGFDAYTTSDVHKGSGLSSSAAFEVCLGTICNGLYNGNRFTPIQLAQVGQLAENRFFGKPSGLMDQTACAMGGTIVIDFECPEQPLVKQIGFDLDAYDYKMVITDTRGNHADLTADYAAVRSEMEAVASFFGKQVLRQLTLEQLLKKIGPLRQQVGDRAVLRAMHFFMECERVPAMAEALQKSDFRRYLRLVRASGHSSFEYNQNVYSPGTPAKQEMAIGLAVAQMLLEGHGAWRLQGGGFAGTIQAYVPQRLLATYCAQMDAVFGAASSQVVTMRSIGCTQVKNAK